jgi:hypothetical protein
MTDTATYEPKKREQLPQRRRCETKEIVHSNGKATTGHPLTLTVGFYPDNRLAECFVTAAKSGTELEATGRDGAVLISLLLQHGVALKTITHSLTANPDGSPSSIIGTVAQAMLEWSAP